MILGGFWNGLHSFFCTLNLNGGTLKQAQADLVFKNICQGGIFWAKWGMSPAWPSCVHDRWNREILRDIGAPQFFEQSRWAGGEKTFPRDAHPGNILVKCYETNELLWCKPTDLIDWNSEEGERLRRQKVPDQYKKALTAAVALADADATTGYAKDNFVAVRRCWDCNAMRNWQVPPPSSGVVAGEGPPISPHARGSLRSCLPIY